MMEILFFNAAGTPLFSRSDLESGNWEVAEMTAQLLFPYKADKVIQSGMLLGFTDDIGVYQVFEIRKVRDYEPDHYQEITAEHIAVSELQDEFLGEKDFENQTAGAVLADILSGTQWSVGTDTTSNTSSAQIANGFVWQDVRTIESNWNVYITPRVTVNSAGITGRYLDITPAGGTWRGIRLSVDKNMDEAGITIDDSNVKTAVYGFGGSEEGETVSERVQVTIADAVWEATASHPAKPAGQKYVEDPTATALYGRNGRARYGYYQNSDITDPDLLLQKTWDYLQTVNKPDVNIDCQVRDLHRMGYADQPLRLHDIALVQIAQTDTSLDREIIKISVDLVDPTATRVTLGHYIPNIVYIAKKTMDEATGGGGGGGGQTTDEMEKAEFHAWLQASAYGIDMGAQRLDYDENVLEQAGMQLNSEGVLIYAEDHVNNIKSVINATASQIRSEVASADSGLYSYIDQTASQIRSLITHAAEIYVQLDDPTTEAGGGITPDEGTVWIVDGDVHTWAEFQGLTWAEISDNYEWRQLLGVQGMVWHDGKWVPFADHGGAILEGTRIDQNQEHIALQAGKVTGLYGELEVTAGAIRSELIDAQSHLGSSITQTASQIRAEVHAADSTLYSVIEQTATQIRSEVTDSVNSLNSSITQTASQIRAEVSDSVNSLNSSITQTASQIRSEVADSVNSLNSSITQTASQIRSEVADSVNSLNSSITQTASQIRSEVSDSVNSLNSSITQTATQIRSEVSDSVNSLNSSITQTASQIRSEVTDSVNSLNSSITQTASQIRSEVSTADNSLRSEILQNASQIALKVSNGNVATQLAVECGNVTISGGNLKISGYMTSDQVITNEINSVNNITTSGTLTANDSYLLRLRVSDNGTYRQATWQSQPVVTSISTTSDTRNWAYWDSGAGDYDFLSKKMINSVTENTTTIYYLGRT